MRIAVYGTGRVAGSLVRAITTRCTSDDAVVAGLSGRSADRAAALAATLGVRLLALDEVDGAADLVVIAVADDAVRDVADRLATAAPMGPAAGARRETPSCEPPSPRWAAHCSGARGPDALAPLADSGVVAATATWHPLQAFPAPDTPLAPGTTWTITTADAELEQRLASLTRALGGRPHALAAEHRAAYHAAAVLAANDVAGVLALAAEVLTDCGFTRREALEALTPLARGAIDAVATHGVPAGLTGPVMRGDVGTITSHLAALDDRPGTQALYRVAGLGLLPYAQARGLAGPRLAEVRAALTKPRDVP